MSNLTIKCPMCAEEIPAEAAVCPLCGTRLVSEPPAPPAPAAARTPVPPRPAPAQVASPPPVRRKNQWVWWLVGGIVVLCLCLITLAVGGILLYRSGLLSPATASPTREIPAPAEPTARPQGITGTLTLWHNYGYDSADEAALLAILQNAEAENPGLDVIVVNRSTSGNSYIDEYLAASASGAGPDILLTDSGSLWSLTNSGTVLGLDSTVRGELDGVRQYALDALTLDGTLYGLPASVQPAALYYNRSLVSAPPTTTDALLDLVKQGKGLDIPDSPAFFAYGFWSAFGGQLMDENGRCIADQGGFDLAMQYLLDLQDAGANVRAEYSEAGDRFRSWETAMVINGPWALTDYRDALGENLGVALLPSGPAGPARPLDGISAFFVNAHSHNTENAVKLALYLTSQDSAQIFTDQAGRVPVRNDVSISDSKIMTFSLAGTLSAPFPPNAQMSGYWGSFGDLFNDVLDNGVSPDDAVQRACEAMNQANGMP